MPLVSEQFTDIGGAERKEPIRQLFGLTDRLMVNAFASPGGDRLAAISAPRPQYNSGVS